MMAVCDATAMAMAAKDNQRLDAWLAVNSTALAEELKAMIPADKMDTCDECDGNGCKECQPDTWFACPDHPDHRVHGDGWSSCPVCGKAVQRIVA